MRRLYLESIDRGRRQIAVRYRFDDIRFHASLWYEHVDFHALEARYGVDYMHRVYVHIALFDLNKLVSLRPDSVDLGEYARFVTPALAGLWRTVTQNIWAQWRYEHGLAAYQAPPLPTQGSGNPARPIRIGAPEGERPEVLSFCGGGKDSLVMNRLFERADVPYASFAYAHSYFGQAEPQLALVDDMLEHCDPAARHRMWVYEDTLDGPVLELYPELGVRTLYAGWTPAALFWAVPLALTHGYRHLVMGNEASSNTGNLSWPSTGEQVNHQWGKSLEAEHMLNDYLRQSLLADGSYFSPLQPIHDAVIFNLIRADIDALPAMHSCNIAKPWCRRCPKCVYVWMNYMAWLEPARVDAIFGENLFDVPEVQEVFRQLVGLGEHVPFECVGQVEESQIAMRLCVAKGVTGKATDACIDRLAPLDLAGFAATFLTVHDTWTLMPSSIAGGLRPQMEAAAEAATAYAHRLLLRP